MDINVLYLANKRAFGYCIYFCNYQHHKHQLIFTKLSLYITNHGLKKYFIFTNLYFSTLSATDIAQVLDCPPESPDNQYHLNK